MKLQDLMEADQKYTAKVEKLFTELETCSEEVLNRKPDEKTWSVIQVMHHVMRSEELGLAYIRKKLSYGMEGIENSGLTHRWRRLKLWFLIVAPIKLKAPAIVSDEHLPLRESLANTREKWLGLRRQWAEFFREMPESLARKAIYKHAVAGKLDWAGVFDFFNGHFDRHYKQIRNTLVRATR